MKTVTLHEIGYAGELASVKNLTDGEWVTPFIRKETPIAIEFTDVSIESMQEVEGISFGKLEVVEAKQTLIERVLNRIFCDMPQELVGKDPEKVRYTRVKTVSGQCLDVSESIDEIKKALT